MAKAFLRMLRSSFSADSLSQREQVALPPWARDAYRCSVANRCQWMLCRRALYPKWAPPFVRKVGTVTRDGATDRAVDLAFEEDDEGLAEGRRNAQTLYFSHSHGGAATRRRGTLCSSTSQAGVPPRPGAQRKCCTLCISTGAATRKCCTFRIST